MMTAAARTAAQAHSALRTGPGAAFAEHWPEYLMEASALGAFMVSACAFVVLLEHPMSSAHQAIPDQFHRRVLIGAAMGVTAIGLILSRWGQRSGAHMNPAVTLSFLWLGKIKHWDALFYILFQFLGAAAGVAVAHMLLGPPLGHSLVNFAVTVPGRSGIRAAFAAEFLISALMMGTVLLVSNSPRLSRFTPYFAGMLVAVFIALEAPYSGMSMNPARTAGSAISAGEWTGWWVYFTAPPLGMLSAAHSYRVWRGVQRVYCAKLHHHNRMRCIFNCNIGALHGNE